MAPSMTGCRGPGGWLRAPDGSIDTGMPIASRRAEPQWTGRGETAAGPGSEAPEATERMNGGP
jgi:hypothetical protein